jgi:copper(I)-binding protein
MGTRRPVAVVALGTALGTALGLAVAGALAGCSGGGGGDRPDLRVGDAWAAQAEDVAAVYLRIDNDGDADRLVGASTAAAGTVGVMTESSAAPGAHEGAEGRVDMAVPPGTTELAPGAGHVMLGALAAPLEPGDTVELTLDFEDAGERAVQVEVLGWDEAVDRNESG